VRDASYPLVGKTCRGGDFIGDPVGYFTAQDFEKVWDAYDSVAGQAFRLARHCKVRSVAIAGRGNSHRGMLRIWVYAATSAGLPDTSREICHSTIRGARGPRFGVPFTCDLKKNKGYVLAVQFKIPIERGGQWYWNVRDGANVSSWINPGDGFATGCTEWQTLESCLGPVENEFVFALQKS
jgi:hypothetical protein